MKRLYLLLLLLSGFYFANAQADLELTGSIDNNNPGIYANVTLTATLLNNGPETAHNIRSRVPFNFPSAAYGLVLAGSNPSKGTYNWLTEWDIDSLESGKSATLEVTFFTMKPQLPLIRAQVVAVDEDDPDSSPNSLTFQDIVAVEDDEFVIDPMGATCDIDIEIISIDCQPSGNGFANVQYRVNTGNPDYERFQVVRYSGSNSPSYQDVLPNTIAFFTIPTNSFGNRLVATPFFQTDNCFDEETFNAPNCSTGACLPASIGFQTINCVEDASGQNFWSLSGTVFSSQQGSWRIEANGAPLAPNGFPQSYLSGDVVSIGGTASNLNIADNPSLTVRIYKISDPSCSRTYTFNAASHCGTPPNNVNCSPRGLFPWHEFLSRVQFDGIDNSTAAAQYTDYSAVTNNVVEAGTTLPIDLTVKYSYITYDEFARVWIDYNADGEFSADEKAFEGKLDAPAQGAGVTGMISGMISIPPAAKNGVVRMRIALKRDGYANPCERFANGEVEDYALTIIGGDTGGCEPIATATGVSCNNNGTPNDPSDDVYYFTLNTSGTVIATGEELFLADGNDNKLTFDRPNAVFGTPFQVGPISIADNPTLTVRQVSNFFPFGTSPACVFPNVVITAPSTCSNGLPTDCGYTATISNLTCDPGGVFSTQDDSYSFDLLIDGAGTGDPVSLYYNQLAQFGNAIVNFDQANAQVGNTFSVGPINIQNYPEVRLSVALPNEGTTCVLDAVVAAPTSDCLDPNPPSTVDCDASSEFPWEDWISRVQIGNLDSESGKSEYSDFRGIRTADLAFGATVDVELTTTFSWFAYEEYWRVWIDYDMDSIYQDDEIVFEGTLPKPPDGAVNRSISGQFVVNPPNQNTAGLTMMRVIMTRNSFPPACGTVLTGEVEDYTVNLLPPSILTSGDFRTSGAKAQLKPEHFTLYPNPTRESATLWTESLMGKKAEIALVNGFGKVVRNWSFDQVETPLTRLDLEGFSNGVYTVRITAPEMRMVTKRLVVVRE